MTDLLPDTGHWTAEDARTHYLYRIFDAAGVLLYVGITHDVGARFQQHRGDKPWWHERHSHTVEEAPTRADVLYLEAKAILTEFPRYNRDIPSFSRFDVLRSRAMVADGPGLSDQDRIRILEGQLRQEKAKVRAAVAEADELRLDAGQAFEFRAELDRSRKLSDDLVKANKYWVGECEAKEQVRVFVVEGQRCSGHCPAAAPAAVPPAGPLRKPTMLERIFGQRP
jgi:hypothetical protein